MLRSRSPLPHSSHLRKEWVDVPFIGIVSEKQRQRLLLKVLFVLTFFLVALLPLMQMDRFSMHSLSKVGGTSNHKKTKTNLKKGGSSSRGSSSSKSATAAASAAQKKPGTVDIEKVLAPPLLEKQTIIVDADKVVRGLAIDRPLVTTLKQLADDAETTNVIPWLTRDYKPMLKRLPEEYHNKPLLARLGDGTSPAPFLLLSKARLIDDEKAIIVPIEYERHFQESLHKYFKDLAPLDIPFKDKETKVFWRGCTTDIGWNPANEGKNPRRLLAEKWGKSEDPRVDIGINHILQDAQIYQGHWIQYYKDPVPMEEQLKYRYLVSVEGNDVATNLKWQLATNSVVMMPPPRREIWSHESQLKPWVHYVPIKPDASDLMEKPWVHYVPIKPDASDLIEKVEQCEKDLSRCEAIAKRATEYIRFFNDEEKTFDLGAARIKDYLDKVTVKIKDSNGELHDP